MHLKNTRRRVLLSFTSIVIFLFSSLSASADIGDSLGGAFDNLISVLGSLGGFINSAMQDPIISKALVIVFGIILLYSIYSAALSQVPLFKDSQKQRNLVSVSLAFISVLGLIFMVDVEQVFTTFGSIAIIALSFAFASAVLYAGQQINPEGGLGYKIGLFLLAAGLCYYLFGAWIDVENKDLGLGLLLLGIIILSMGYLKIRIPSMGGGGFSFGGGRREPSPSDSVRKTRQERKRDRVQKKGVSDKTKDSVRHIHHLAMQFETRKKNEQQNQQEMEEFIEHSKNFMKHLDDFVNSMPKMNLQDLFHNLTGSQGVDAAVSDMLFKLGKKEINFEKKDKKLDRKMVKMLNKIIGEIDSDQKEFQKEKNTIEKRLPHLKPEQKEEATRLDGEYSRLINELEQNKNLAKQMLKLEMDIQLLHKEDFEIGKQKKDRLKTLKDELEGIRKNIEELQKKGGDAHKTTEHVQKIEAKIKNELSHLESEFSQEESHLNRLHYLCDQLNKFDVMFNQQVRAESQEINAVDEEVDNMVQQEDQIDQQLEPLVKNFTELEHQAESLKDKVLPVIQKSDKGEAINSQDFQTLQQSLQEFNKILSELNNLAGNEVIKNDEELLREVQQFQKVIQDDIQKVSQLIEQNKNLQGSPISQEEIDRISSEFKNYSSYTPDYIRKRIQPYLNKEVLEKEDTKFIDDNIGFLEKTKDWFTHNKDNIVRAGATNEQDIEKRISDIEQGVKEIRHQVDEHKNKEYESRKSHAEDIMKQARTGLLDGSVNEDNLEEMRKKIDPIKEWFMANNDWIKKNNKDDLVSDIDNFWNTMKQAVGSGNSGEKGEKAAEQMNKENL